MTFNSEDIYELADIVWSTVLALPIEPDTSGSVGRRPRSMAACIQITGGWNGAIVLDCPASVARHAAAIMFQTQPAQVSMADIQDAIGELANIVGGHVKSLLPQPCHLSLPTVIEGGDYSTRVPGSRLVSRVGFVCDGDTASISILEKAEARHANV